MKIGLFVALIALLIAAAVSPRSPRHRRPSKTAAADPRLLRLGRLGRAVAKQAKQAKAWLNKRTRAKHAPKKPALVLDIDETALNNYPCLDEQGRASPTTAASTRAAWSPTTPPPSSPCSRSSSGPSAGDARLLHHRPPRGDPRRHAENLRAAGYKGKYELILRPPDTRRSRPFPTRAGARKRIQRRGYKILANVGDQRSDLKGGYSERTYKLPNLIYFTE